MVDEGTGDPIDPDDKGRGYEVDKGVYLQVEDEELDAIAIESSHTIDIDSFVPKSEVDERYVDSPYYLVPENKVALEAFAVIRDAMLGKGMVALGRVVLSKRERVIMLQPRGKGLLGATLRYPYEVRDEAIYFGDIGEIQIPKDMLALAEHILESKAATFDPTLFHDRYEEAVVAMLNEKRAGMPIPKQRPMPRIVAGTDLMAALRQSIDKAKEETPKTAARQAAPGAAAPAAAKPSAPAKGKRTAKGSPDQREMLLPIAGGAPAKEAGAARKGSARETDRAKARRTEKGGIASLSARHDRTPVAALVRPPDRGARSLRRDDALLEDEAAVKAPFASGDDGESALWRARRRRSARRQAAVRACLPRDRRPAAPRAAPAARRPDRRLFPCGTQDRGRTCRAASPTGSPRLRAPR